MKKIYFLLLCLMSIATYGQSPIITAIVDGDCSGGNPKLLEIYAEGTVDFSLYSIENQTNANTDWGNQQALTDLGTVTDGFVYITTSGSSDAIASDFPSLATANVLESNTMNLNGDDRVRIILTSDSSVIDQYGVEGTDGSGTDWEYKDSYAKRANGTGPDSVFTPTNWVFGGVSALDGLGVCQNGTETFESLIGGVGTYSSTGTPSPSVSITTPTNNTEFDSGTISVNVEFTTANLVGGESVTITVNGTESTNATSPFSITTVDGETYAVTADLIDATGTISTSSITFSVANPTTTAQVATITELRNGNMGDEYVYELTGEAIISYLVTSSTRNQKYIQDAGAGILIDDPAGIITTTFAIGDGMTGVTGTLSEYLGVLQFTPTEDVAAASSTGNTITPISVSASEFASNGEAYESRLITVTDVMFSETGNFESFTNYTLTDGADATTARTSFSDEDLIGSAIPTSISNVTGLGGEYNGEYQILPRYISDIAEALSVNDFNTNTFSVYPNPTTTGSVTITSVNTEVISVQVFDILGKQVKNEVITNNTLNVANLKSGVYIVKITQNNASTTKKLVIK
ncbi:T9SS type A sorting domain-containing protein [Winogradskyella arenosi]|uniref:Putative secreted protein (Por secretion system target) n=1 Tax=Winogradskyella arenosi TaxID=533325 RepID=A0A368ZJH7_9FLAO|nr:T9SS type A sorting domain-containing protein [Winogradskyella arenosi]RCW93884.1 putative secreted protein (Por secretion system target) [Winogradskyella arenosi]